MSGVLGVLEPTLCPCGGGRQRAYADCCRPLVAGEALPETAEALMRSRYTAYAVGNLAHIERTWHPRTLPADLQLDAQLRWTGLTVSAVTDGGEADTTGTVAFTAAWESGTGSSLQRGVIDEVSRFDRRAGRWFYVGPDRG